MQTEGVTFPEAVERLAAMAGVPLPKFSKDEEAREEKRKTLHDVMELAAKFFEATLAARAGAKARGYLADRALDPATQLKFRLGYAPGERFALKEHLGGQGVSVEDMVETGLLIAGDDIPVPYDRFRDRVMFPITDFRGRIIAFGGRALVADAPGEVSQLAGDAALSQGLEPLQRRRGAAGGARRRAADRGRGLCRRDRHGHGGLSGDRRAARHRADRGPAWPALEDGGRADPLLRRRQGRPARGLSRGRYGDAAAQARQEPALRDAAGRPGPRRSVSAPAGARRSPRCSAARGRSATCCGRARPKAASFDTPERRAALEARVNEVVRSIGDESVRKYYAQDFTARLRQLLMPQSDRERSERPRGMAGQVGGGQCRSGNVRDFSRGRAFLAARPVECARADGAAERAAQRQPDRARLPHRAAAARGADPGRGGQPSLAAGTPRRGVRRARIPQSRRRPAAAGRRWKPQPTPVRPTRRRCARRSRRAGLAGVLARVEAAITHASDWPARAGASAEDVAQWWTHVVTLHRKQRTLNRELKDAERALGEEPTDANLAWLRDVQGRLSALDGTEAQIEGFGSSSGRPARSV